MKSVLISLIFLLSNVGIVLLILFSNWKAGSKSGGNKQAVPLGGDRQPAGLEPGEILKWEFEYARTTASEAMGDRHTMINYYLVIVSVLASGIVALLGRAERQVPLVVGTALLWLLVVVGWFLFLMLIRLRQAWRDSAQTMNAIKAFYIENAGQFPPNALWEAFRWKPGTLPLANKRWTVYHYSAMLIGFLDSAAYVAGGALLHAEWKEALPSSSAIGLLVLLGALFFLFHALMYRAFLRS